MDTATRVQILNGTVCISYSANTFGKSINATILLSSHEQSVEKTLEKILGEGKIKIKICFCPLKTDHISNPANMEG